MAVRAYFEVSRVVPSEYQAGAATVELFAAFKDGQNVDWSKWTPAGSIKLQITNPAAVEQFVEGKRYYVVFEEEEETAK